MPELNILLMKDNKQLRKLKYRQPEIEFVRVQQESFTLTGSDEDDAPGAIVSPENASGTNGSEANAEQADICVTPPTQLPPKNLGWN